MKVMKEPKDIMNYVEEYGVMKKQSIESAKIWYENEKKKPFLTEEEAKEKMLRERRRGISIAIGLGTAFVAILAFFLIVDTDAIMFI